MPGHRIEGLAKNHVSSEPIREVLVLNNDMVEKLIMTMLETNDTVRGKIRDYLVDPTIENLEEPAELLLQIVRAKGKFNLTHLKEIRDRRIKEQAEKGAIRPL